ncbi:MAG: glycosyltransferase [Actinomycetota bacterium]|nr:glycosyltransferase [Actinomycetota bacterium]
MSFTPVAVAQLDLADDAHDGLRLAGMAGDATPHDDVSGTVRTRARTAGRTRVLVRLADRPVGFVELDLDPARPAGVQVRERADADLADELAPHLAAVGCTGVPLDELPRSLADRPRPFRDARDLPPITVAVCTRDRPESLRRCLRSLLAVDHPDHEILVVDNAPATSATRDLVERELGATPIRYVCEPAPGLSNARNRALAEATHSLVAFTDDDVEVDGLWLRALSATFASDASVACVTGLVPTASLENETELHFDRKVSWSSHCTSERFALDMAEPPFALFPYAAGHFGTGANFAIRREAIQDLGGFDAALGAGSPTRGGEDLDAFLRVLLAGHALAYEPAAVVWHHHRATPEDLRRQMWGYGVGCAAYLAKHLTSRRTGPPMIRRMVPAMLGMGRHWQGSVAQRLPPFARVRGDGRHGRRAPALPAGPPREPDVAGWAAMTALLQRRSTGGPSPTPPPGGGRPDDGHASERLFPWVALAFGATCYLVTITEVEVADLGDFGLIGSLSVAYAIGLAAVTTGFLVELLSSAPRRSPLAALTGGLIVLLYGVAPAVYSLPRYAWLYKHLAVVEAIDERGGIDRLSSIYDNWAGFFGIAATLSGLLHIDPIRFAAWAELFFALVEALAVGYLVRGLTGRRQVAFGAVWLFTASNWVGQNYFAPQPLAFVFVVLALGVAVRELVPARAAPLRTIPGSFLADARRVLRPRGVRSGLAGAAGHAQAVLASPAGLASVPRPSTAVVVVLVLHTATVVTHQLSPFMSLAIFGGLTVLCDLRPRWLLVAMTAITLGWIGLASDYLLNHTELFGALGDVRSNAGGAAAQRVVTEAESGRVIATVARSLSLGVWGLGAIGALVAIVRRRVDRRVLVMAGAPMAMLAVNGYGGEVIYRVFLFSLPAMAYLGADLLFGGADLLLGRNGRLGIGQRRRHRAVAAPAAFLLCLAFTAAFVVVSYGRDRVNRMEPEELALVAWLDDHGAPESTVAVMFPNLPTTNTTEFVYSQFGLMWLPPRSAERPSYTPQELCDAAYAWAGVSRSGEAYLIASESQFAYAEAYGYAPDLELADIDAALEECGLYERRFSNEAGGVWEIDRQVVRQAVTSAMRGGADGG